MFQISPIKDDYRAPKPTLKYSHTTLKKQKQQDTIMEAYDGKNNPKNCECPPTEPKARQSTQIGQYLENMSPSKKLVEIFNV